MGRIFNNTSSINFYAGYIHPISLQDFKYSDTKEQKACINIFQISQQMKPGSSQMWAHFTKQMSWSPELHAAGKWEEDAYELQCKLSLQRHLTTFNFTVSSVFVCNVSGDTNFLNLFAF